MFWNDLGGITLSWISSVGPMTWHMFLRAWWLNISWRHPGGKTLAWSRRLDLWHRNWTDSFRIGLRSMGHALPSGIHCCIFQIEVFRNMLLRMCSMEYISWYLLQWVLRFRWPPNPCTSKHGLNGFTNVLVGAQWGDVGFCWIPLSCMCAWGSWGFVDYSSCISAAMDCGFCWLPIFCRCKNGF